MIDVFDVLDPLIKHLRADETLEFTAGGKYIFLMSNYEGVTPDNQYSPALWIIPLAAPPAISGAKGSACPMRMNLQLFIAVAVKNVSDQRNGVAFNDFQLGSTYIGAYPEAANLRKLVRTSILNLNETIAADSRSVMDVFSLVQLPKPDVHNGHLILPQIYETTFTF